MEFRYKQEVKNVEQRKKYSQILLMNNPKKVPIILEKDPNCGIHGIEKTKFLIEKDFTIAQFQLLLRSLMKMQNTDAFFLLAKGKYTLIGEHTMYDIYKKYKDKEDGFLYIIYSTELVYG